MLRILFLGDIVGEPGRSAVIRLVPVYLKERSVDFVIVNGENAAGGRGITGKIAIDLLRSGVAVITSGDHIWDQRDTTAYIATEPRLLRPINYPLGAPGQGSLVLETAKGKIAVLNVQGRTFMQPILDNPFHAALAAVEQLRRETPTIIVDMHAETTSEKIAMGRFLDGRVSAVVGTHTHVQTADERIFPGEQLFSAMRACADRTTPVSAEITSRSSRDSWTGYQETFPSPAVRSECAERLSKSTKIPGELCTLAESTRRSQNRKSNHRASSNNHLLMALRSKKGEMRI